MVSKNNEEKIKKDEEIQEVELLIGKILRIGVGVASGVILVGLLLFLLTGKTGYAKGEWPKNILKILTGVLSAKPFAILMAGLLILIFIPVIRVIASIASFAKERDFLYVKITILVLLILLTAIFLTTC